MDDGADKNSVLLVSRQFGFFDSSLFIPVYECHTGDNSIKNTNELNWIGK